jgi:quercetin dioxygenase-like cupin family protein
MCFFDSSKREKRQIAEGIHMRTFWGENMLISLVDLEPHVNLPLHRHPHEQLGLVLEGELLFQLGDTTERISKGMVYVIPSNVEHGAETFEAGAKVIDIFYPVREDYKY